MLSLYLRPLFWDVSRFLVSHPIHDFYAEISTFYTNILCYLVFYVRYRTWCAGWGVGRFPLWLWGGCRLVRGVTRACSFTCYPDPWFRVPARLPFPQGTGDPSSADHTRIGLRNGDCYLSVYPHLYLQKGSLSFLWHYLTQLIEHN